MYTYKKPSLIITHRSNGPAACSWSSVEHLRTCEITTLRTDLQNSESSTSQAYHQTVGQQSMLRKIDHSIGHNSFPSSSPLKHLSPSQRSDTNSSSPHLFITRQLLPITLSISSAVFHMVGWPELECLHSGFY